MIEYEDYKIKYELFCVYCERFSGVGYSIKNHILKNETKNLFYPIMQVIPISFLLGHSGGEQSLGETKYIIGDSYTVWATTFGIN